MGFSFALFSNCNMGPYPNWRTNLWKFVDDFW